MDFKDSSVMKTAMTEGAVEKTSVTESLDAEVTTTIIEEASVTASDSVEVITHSLTQTGRQSNIQGLSGFLVFQITSCSLTPSPPLGFCGFGW